VKREGNQVANALALLASVLHTLWLGPDKRLYEHGPTLMPIVSRQWLANKVLFAHKKKIEKFI